MTDLRTFLTEMALDPAKFAEFLREPEAAMRAHELSEEDRAALLSGIPAMIWSRLAAYLAFPPPYYTPALIWAGVAGYPRPTYVTMPPLIPGSAEIPTPINFVTVAPLYVTSLPPLYLPASPVFVTSSPQPVAPEKARETPTPATKAPPKRKA
jgi:hypothetical protein